MPLRVMTYNVRYFGHALKGAGSTRASLHSIAHALATLDGPADVVCLQEVEARSWRSRLSHTPGKEEETQLEALMACLDEALALHGQSVRYRSFYFPAHAYRLAGSHLYTTGLAILVAGDLEVVANNAENPHDITHRRLRRAAKLKQSRICAHLRVRDRRGKSVDIFNTHLSLPAFATREFITGRARMGYGQNQAAEVDQLAAFIEANKDSERFLVLGDFNSLPESPAYTRLLGHTGAIDPFPRFAGVSALELRRVWPTAGFLHLRMRLDHVFAGGRMECIDFEESHPFGSSGRWDGLSDHVPLVGRFGAT